jgi:hypothetical protein
MLAQGASSGPALTQAASPALLAALKHCRGNPTRRAHHPTALCHDLQPFSEPTSIAAIKRPSRPVNPIRT